MSSFVVPFNTLTKYCITARNVKRFELLLYCNMMKCYMNVGELKYEYGGM